MGCEIMLYPQVSLATWLCNGWIILSYFISARLTMMTAHQVYPVKEAGKGAVMTGLLEAEESEQLEQQHERAELEERVEECRREDCCNTSLQTSVSSSSSHTMRSETH